VEFLNDFTVSVRKSLEEIDPSYQSYNGLVVCGTHAPHDTEMMIDKIQEARKNGTPTLLICFGNQLGAIQWARDNRIPDATSEEFGEGTFVVKKRPELKVGLHEGESWWSNYEVVIDWEIPKNFISVPFHPEYQSSKDKPHPILKEFLETCKNQCKHEWEIMGLLGYFKKCKLCNLGVRIRMLDENYYKSYGE